MIEAMKLVRDAIEQGVDLNLIGAKHILDQAIAEAEKQDNTELDAICQDLQEMTYTQAMRIAELEAKLAEKQSTKCVTSVSEVEHVVWVHAGSFDAMIEAGAGYSYIYPSKRIVASKPLYTHPQPKAEKQEPVAYLLRRQDRSGYETGEKTDYGAFPVYTASQQHTWIGLTDEDCERMSAGDKVVAMWAERTLKKKNTHQQPNVTTSDMKQEHVDKTAKQRHEWVGLTGEERETILKKSSTYTWKAIELVEAKLKEKNT